MLPGWDGKARRDLQSTWYSEERHSLNNGYFKTEIQKDPDESNMKDVMCSLVAHRLLAPRPRPCLQRLTVVCKPSTGGVVHTAWEISEILLFFHLV